MTAFWIIFVMLLWGLGGMALGKARHQHPVKSFLVAGLLGPLGVGLILVSKPDPQFTRPS